MENYLFKKHIRNQFYFLNIDKYQHLFKFHIYYKEKNLLYIQALNVNKTLWNDDIKLRLFSIDKKSFEDLSIGGSSYENKEIELFTEIDLEELPSKVKVNIPNQIIQSKKKDSFQVQDVYHFYYFMYQNKNYSYMNLSKNDLIGLVQCKYNEIINTFDNFLGEEIKLFILILLYLNLNGGIYISEHVKDIGNLDELDIDKNTILCKNNYIYFLSAQMNFLDIEKLKQDLYEKKPIHLHAYCMGCREFQHKLKITSIKISPEQYFSQIEKVGAYQFLLLSKHKYEIETLANDYFSIGKKDKGDIQMDEFKLVIRKKELEIMFQESNIKFKNKNSFIFKI